MLLPMFSCTRFGRMGQSGFKAGRVQERKALFGCDPEDTILLWLV